MRVIARLDRAIQTPKSRRVKRRYAYRPVLFFVVAYAATWIPWSAAAWASQRGLEAYAVLFNLIGLLGPPGATLYLIRHRHAALRCNRRGDCRERPRAIRGGSS
jgi:hypothetical protein